MNETKQLSKLYPGDIFKVKEVEFIVLKQKQEETLVMLKTSTEKHIFDTDSSLWENSSLRKYLNETILPIYEDYFGSENIIEHTISPETEQKTTYKDKIRLLSLADFELYQDIIKKNSKIEIEWTMTPFYIAKYIRMAIIKTRTNNKYTSSDVFKEYNFRPVFVLNSKIEVEIMPEVLETVLNIETEKTQRVLFVNHQKLNELNDLLKAGWKVMNTCQMLENGASYSNNNGVFFTLER